MAVNLTSGAIWKIVTGKSTSRDPPPVLQLIGIDSVTSSIKDKQWYGVLLSDGSFFQLGFIPDDIFISNKLHKGDILRLTKFQLMTRTIPNKSAILVWDFHLLHSKCDSIGHPKRLPDNETPLVKRTTPTIRDKDHTNSRHVEEPTSSKLKQDHVDSLLNENIDDSRHVEEAPTTIQNPTQNKKRKLQSSNDIILGFGKDISKLVTMTVEKTIEDGLGSCYKRLGTLEEGVLKMMEKNKEVDVGFEKLKTLEENVSKLTRMIIEKNKEDVVGFKKLDTLEEHVSKMTKLMTEKSKEADVGFKKLGTLEEGVSKIMEKNKEVDVGFEKLKTLEENVSKLTRMIMEKNKEDVVGFKKLDTLEEHVSKMTKLMTEKSKEVDVGFKKLETLEEDVSKLMRMVTEKNKEDDVGACFKKLERLEEDVSKLTRMMMEKNKEDDMGACIEKLDKMGWGAEEPIYETALLLFGQSVDYRKLWLHLKPECCWKWVKNAGSMFGLLD